VRCESGGLGDERQEIGLNNGTQIKREAVDMKILFSQWLFWWVPRSVQARLSNKFYNQGILLQCLRRRGGSAETVAWNGNYWMVVRGEEKRPLCLKNDPSHSLVGVAFGWCSGALEVAWPRTVKVQIVAKI